MMGPMQGGGITFFLDPEALPILLEPTKVNSIVHCSCGRAILLNVRRVVIEHQPKSALLMT